MLCLCPSNYKATIGDESNDFTITNSYQKPDPKPDPDPDPVDPDPVDPVDPEPDPDPVDPVDPPVTPPVDPPITPPVDPKPPWKPDGEDIVVVDPDKEDLPYPVPADTTVYLDLGKIPLAGRLNKKDHIAYIYGYPDTSVRPLGEITRDEVVAVFFRLMLDSYRDSMYRNYTVFPDVANDRWSQDNISTLWNAGIIVGNPDGTFKPGNPITRAEVAVIASKFDNLTYVGPSRFTDIEGHWAEMDINSAALKGWIVGGDDGKFRPNDNITRAEFVTLVNGVLDRDTRIENMLPNRIVFNDLDLDKWYAKEIEEAANGHDYIRLEDKTESWTKLLEDMFLKKYGKK